MSFPISFSLSVGGDQKHPKAGTLHIHQVLNGRSTAAFTLISQDRSYRPPLDSAVTIVENGTTIFGGIIDRPQERGLARGTHPAILTPVSAVDYHAYVDRRIALTTIPAGTMKAAVEQLRSEYLDEFGITLNPSQVDGPDLPYIEFGGWKLHDALKHVLTMTAGGASPAEIYAYRIDFDKELTAFQPSTLAAPFDLIGDTLPLVVGDIEVETSRDSTYANKIIARIPATATTPDVYVYAEDFSQSATYGTWEKYFVLNDQPTEADAQAFVDAELEKSAHIRRVVRYATFEGGLAPGMLQTIEVPARDVEVDGVITEMVTRDFGKDRLIRYVTVTIDDSGTNIGRGWGDVIRGWSEDKQGAGAGGGQVTSTAFAPASPNRSVQFNKSGVFGGDAAFTYYEDENSLVCGGGGSSITAASFESCQVFGYNNHIADP